jgi:hypothetical protein
MNLLVWICHIDHQTENVAPSEAFEQGRLVIHLLNGRGLSPLPQSANMLL